MAHKKPKYNKTTATTQGFRSLLLLTLLSIPIVCLGEFEKIDQAEEAFKNGDYAKVMELAREPAEQGDVLAQTLLGDLYFYGYGVTEDPKKAVKWYRKAAAKGNVIAQNNIGFAYSEGRGLPEDYEKAVKWYRKAAEQGDATAQFNLAGMYREGEGVTRNNEKAAEWNRKAAEQGHPKAQYNLGVDYKNGSTVPQNYEKAREWLQKSADQGFQLAEQTLKTLPDGREKRATVASHKRLECGVTLNCNSKEDALRAMREAVRLMEGSSSRYAQGISGACREQIHSLRSMHPEAARPSVIRGLIQACNAGLEGL